MDGDNDFGGLARDLERERQRKEAAANPPNPKQRYGDMKVPLGYVPAASTVYEALALAEGARKYGPYNWRDKVVEAMTYAHAALRHLHLWIDGEDIDPESGRPHLGHAKASLGILADAIECGQLIDNRPLPAPTGELLQRWKKPQAPAVDTLTPIGDTEGYPFTSHRTMAEVMAEESRGSSAARQAGAFGEGDETAEETATPKYEDMQAVADRHPCDCDRGRCKIENGWGVGSRVFCCQAEEICRG